MRKKLYLFTNTFPYGKGETFLEAEIKFLAGKFDVIIIPLHTEKGLRAVPDNVRLYDPLISFSPKDKKRMLQYGIFNFSPLFFAFRDFFERKVYRKGAWIYNFFVSLLLTRAMLSNKKALNHIKKESKKGDVLYFYWGDKSALVLPFWKEKLGLKSFVKFHRTDIYEEMRSGYIPFRKLIFMHIDKFLTISENGREYLLSNYKQLQADDVILSRLGVFENGNNPTPSKDVIFHLVSCSYISPVKRLDLLIDALSLTGKNIRWTHFGGGILEEEIKQKANKLPANIETNFRGHVSNAELMEIYRKESADLFINVSSSEGIPVSIMEAFSFGIPAIATDVGGTSELVNEQTGMLIPADITADELVKAIKSMIEKDLSIYRKAAKAKWAADFDAEKNYYNLLDILDS